MYLQARVGHRGRQRGRKAGGGSEEGPRGGRSWVKRVLSDPTLLC